MKANKMFRTSNTDSNDVEVVTIRSKIEEEWRERMSHTIRQGYLKAIHVTATGSKMLIAQMETQHLLNTVNYAFTKISALVPQTVVEKTPQSSYRSALYGQQEVNPKIAAQIVSDSYDAIAPYALEVMFRMEEIAQNDSYMETFREIRKQMETLLQRTGKLEDLCNLPSVVPVELLGGGEL